MLILLLAVAGRADGPARAQSVNRVGLVVRFSDDEVTTRCVEFTEPQISGYDVLTRSGLDVVASFDPGLGVAVCAIEGVGCPLESCLTCDVPNYWSYWHLQDGAWAYSQVGASGYMVSDGEVEGWSWGEGTPPPVIPFDQICAPPPAPTPTSTPTSTPTPPPSPTPPPTPMVWFRLDENPIPAGACTTVRWDTANAREVYLDGERVPPIGSREVCPTAPQEYRLRVVSAVGEQVYTLVLGVVAASPSPTSIPTPPPAAPTSTTTPSPEAAPSPTATPVPSPTPSPRSAAVISPTSPPRPAATQPPAASPTVPATPLPVDRGTAGSHFPTGYVVFGVLAAGLLAGLLLGARRRG